MHNLNSRYLEIQQRLLMARLGIRHRTLFRDWGESDEDFCLGEWFGRRIENTVSGLEKRGCRLYPELERIRFYEEQLQMVIDEAREKKVIIPLEELCIEHCLNDDEKTILLALFFDHFHGRSISGATLMKLVSATLAETLTKIELISPWGTLIRNGLIRRGEFRTIERSIFESRFELTEETFWKICGIARPSGDAERLALERCSVILVKEPELSFAQLVLPERLQETIEQALWCFSHGQQVFQEFDIADKIPYGRGTVMLFAGPPGTGKTATAEAIAKVLGKKLGIASYSHIYECWFGESEKNIQRVFQEAKEADCILLFDEADACFGARLDEIHSADRAHNLMTNILMQEIERFSGLVILTTNREFALDQAFERRILLKLQFAIPDAEERQKIWELFLKDCPRLGADVSFSELARRYPLAGGKVKNAVLKAVIAAARSDRSITMADLETAAREEMGKEEKRRVGF